MTNPTLREIVLRVVDEHNEADPGDTSSEEMAEDVALAVVERCAEWWDEALPPQGRRERVPRRHAGGAEVISDTAINFALGVWTVVGLMVCLAITKYLMGPRK